MSTPFERIEDCRWAWYRCPGCKDERLLPRHWGFHTCESCSTKNQTVQMRRV